MSEMRMTLLKDGFDGVQIIRILSSFMLRRHFREIGFQRMKSSFVRKCETRQEVLKAFQALFKDFPIIMKYYDSPEVITDRMMMYEEFEDPRKLNPENNWNYETVLVYENRMVFAHSDPDRRTKKYVFMDDMFNAQQEALKTMKLDDLSLILDLDSTKKGFNEVCAVDDLQGNVGCYFKGDKTRKSVKICGTGFGNVIPVTSFAGTQCIPITYAFRRVVTYLMDDIQIFQRLEPDNKFESYCRFHDILELVVKFFGNEHGSGTAGTTRFVDVEALENFLDILDSAAAKFFSRTEPWKLPENLLFEKKFQKTETIVKIIEKIHPLTMQMVHLNTIVEQFPKRIEYRTDVSVAEHNRNIAHVILTAAIIAESSQLIEIFHKEKHCFSFVPSCLKQWSMARGYINYCTRLAAPTHRLAQPCWNMMCSKCSNCEFCDHLPIQFEILKNHKKKQKEYRDLVGLRLNGSLDGINVRNGFHKTVSQQLRVLMDQQARMKQSEKELAEAAERLWPILNSIFEDEEAQKEKQKYERTNLALKLKVLEKENSILKTKLEMANTTVDYLKNFQKRSEDVKSSLEAERESLWEKVAKLQFENEKFARKCEILESEKSIWKENYKEVRGQLEKLEEDHEKKEKDFEVLVSSESTKSENGKSSKSPEKEQKSQF